MPPDTGRLPTVGDLLVRPALRYLAEFRERNRAASVHQCGNGVVVDIPIVLEFTAPLMLTYKRHQRGEGELLYLLGK